MKVVGLTSALLLSACVSFNSNYALNRPASAGGVAAPILTATVGDIVVERGRHATTAAIRVASDVKLGIVRENRIRAGYYVKQGENARSEYLKPEKSRNGGAITRFFLADPIKGIQAYKDRPTLCTVSVFNIQDCRNDVAFTRVERPAFATSAIGQHLVFAGRDGDTLRFDHVKTAADRTDGRIDHDLTRSRRVTVDGMTIEIVDVVGDTMRYRIVAAGKA